MTSPFAGIFALLLSATFAACVPSPTGNLMKWSSHYFAEGNILIPLAGVNEPFKAWLDLESKMSRIEYYDGMTNTYQFPDGVTERSGFNYRVTPVANTITNNTMICFVTYNENNWHTQSIVPDLENFVFHSKRVEDDRTVEKWIHKTTERNVHNRYEILLYKKGNNIYPVRFETKGYNTIFNAHVDHYIIEYKNFSIIKPDPIIFDVEDKKCTSDPESGIGDVYYFNPMKEFVQNYGEHVDLSFEQFKRHHNKNYIDGTAEHFKRKSNFRQNMRFIHSKNRANVKHKLAANHFTDYSSEELASVVACRKAKQRDYDTAEYNASFSLNDLNDLPSKVNWQIAGAVTPVKDQGLCGSCWSFAAVGALEGAYFIKHGKRLRFSEQALIDCSWPYDNFGCSGGFEESAYDFMKIHGIPTAEQYGPYLSQDGYCHMANISSASLTKISNFQHLKFRNKLSLQKALLNHGPMSVSVNVSPKSFKFYSSGVYYDEECESSTLTHAMLLVGYGTLDGEPYWLLKNSWSPMWGNDGYILVSSKDNMCGVLSNPVYVEL